MNTAALKKFNTATARTYALETWNWWLAELKNLVPERIKAAIFPAAVRIEVGYGQDNIALTFHGAKEGKRERIELPASRTAQADLKNLSGKYTGQYFQNTAVDIDPALLFRKNVVLPSAFKKNLQQILTLRLEHYFPLGSQDVHFGCRIIRENQEAKTIEVVLVFLRKHDAAEIIRFLKRLNIKTRRITFASGREGEKVFLETVNCKALLSGPGLKRILQSPPALALAFWLLMFTGYGGYLGVSEALLENRAEEYQARLSETARQIADFEAFKRKEQTLIGALEGPNALEITDELSRLLPVEGWIDDFSMSGDSIEISGFHPNPPGIVERFASSFLFERVELLSVEDTRAGPSFRISFALAQNTGEGP